MSGLTGPGSGSRWATSPVLNGAAIVTLVAIGGLSIRQDSPPTEAAPVVASQALSPPAPAAVVEAPVEVGPQARTGAVTPVSNPNAVDAADIPAAAFVAYSRVEQILREARPGCGLSWYHVAAIGRVESNHGAAPAARPASGGNSTADTDGGDLDGDPRADQRVGPMRFLPSTWRSVQVDGDGDGVRDPRDIDDAALGAGVLLCSGGEDLRQQSGLVSALRRFNGSADYAALVQTVAEAYRVGSLDRSRHHSDDPGAGRHPADPGDAGGRVERQGPPASRRPPARLPARPRVRARHPARSPARRRARPRARQPRLRSSHRRPRRPRPSHPRRRPRPACRSPAPEETPEPTTPPPPAPSPSAVPAPDESTPPVEPTPTCVPAPAPESGPDYTK